MTKKTPKYNVSLSVEEGEALNAIAGRFDMSRSEVLRRALAHYGDAVKSGQITEKTIAASK